MKYCANCGFDLETNPGDEKFCPGCGEPVAAGQARSSSADRPKFEYAAKENRKSQVITIDDPSGEPIVRFRNLHPNAVWLFFMQYLAKTSILLLLFVLGAIVEPLLSAALTLIYLLVLYLTARLNYKNFEFELTPVAYHGQYGVLHKYTVDIAFDQIQNINVRRTMIDQMLGLASIEIETAGTGGEVQKNVGGLMTGSEGYIPGLTPNEADDVRDLMLARINEV